MQGQFLAYKAVSYRANLPDNKPLFALKLSKMCEVFGNLIFLLKFKVFRLLRSSGLEDAPTVYDII